MFFWPRIIFLFLEFAQVLYYNCCNGRFSFDIINSQNKFLFGRLDKLRRAGQISDFDLHFSDSLVIYGSEDSTLGPWAIGGGGGGEAAPASASQYPRRTSPSCGVNPRAASMTSAAQQWCSMTRIALQQPGPRYVSPLRKKSTTSPMQDRSSISESQHSFIPSDCSRAARCIALPLQGPGVASDIEMLLLNSSRIRRKGDMEEYYC